jgi:hypothetical protein
MPKMTKGLGKFSKMYQYLAILALNSSLVFGEGQYGGGVQAYNRTTSHMTFDCSTVTQWPSDINYSKINSDCLNAVQDHVFNSLTANLAIQISLSAWKNLNYTRVLRIFEGKMDHLSIFDPQLTPIFNALLPKITASKISEDVEKQIVYQILAFSNMLLESSIDQKELSKLLTSSVIARMEGFHCGNLDRVHFANMPDNALKKVRNECIKAISPSSFSRLKKSCAEELDVTACQALTLKQVKSINVRAYEGFTNEHGDNWGPTIEVPVNNEELQEDPKEIKKRISEFKKLARAHPCMYMPQILKMPITTEFREAIKGRCETICANSAHLGPRASIGLALLASAAYLVFMSIL